jgi:P4 family phage/plasmid primase-like protien
MHRTTCGDHEPLTIMGARWRIDGIVCRTDDPDLLAAWQERRGTQCGRTIREGATVHDRRRPGSRRRTTRHALEDTGDTGLINRLARLVGVLSDTTGQPLICVPEHGCFYRWEPWDDGAGVWLRDDDHDSAAREATLHVTQDLTWQLATLPSDERERFFKAVEHSKRWATRKMLVDGLKSHLRVLVNADQLDVDPFLLVVRNGTLNLCQGNVIPSRPMQLNTRACAVDYDSKATSKKLDDFLERFLPDLAERDHALGVLGAALIGGNPNRVFVVVIGPTTTGKTTLFKLLRVTLGRYCTSFNPSVFRGNLDDKPRPDLLDVMTARIIVGFEPAETWELHADQIKRSTGGDPVKARGMRSKTMLEFVPTFTPFVVCNVAPQVKGGVDSAVRGRLRVILMDRQLTDVGDDPTIAAELVADPEAQRALPRLLIEAVKRYGGRVPVDVPERFALKTMEVFGELSDVGRFVADLRQSGQLYYQTAEEVAPGVPASAGLRCAGCTART